MRIEIIHEKRKLAASITGIAKRGKALDEDIHQCAVSALHHAAEHGDLTFLRRIVDAMPKSSRRLALIHWATNHAPVKYQKKDGQFKVIKSKNQAENWLVNTAMETPFWDFSKERKPLPFDINRYAKSVMSRLEKALAKGEATPEDVATLRKQIASLEA